MMFKAFLIEVRQKATVIIIKKAKRHQNLENRRRVRKRTLKFHKRADVIVFR